MASNEYPKADSGHVIEIPAKLASKLSAEQCTELEDHARTYHDSRKLLVKVEHILEGNKGMSVDDAVKKAKEELGSQNK